MHGESNPINQHNELSSGCCPTAECILFEDVIASGGYW
jgi:hypothetical protein